LTLTISNGTLTVTSGGSGSGTVTPAGAFNASDGTCSVAGRFWEDNGRAGGSGSVRCATGGATCFGTWNVLRN
jgi:hypothetical protein